MNPHSVHSQFNQRTPKSGPQAQNTRFMASDIVPTKSFPPLIKQAKATSSNASAALLMRRPISTNSRVKQDEKYRSDMYLAYINNALQQKVMGVSEPFNDLVNQFNPKNKSPEDPALLPSQLRLWISALSHVVSRLEPTHSALVQALVNMPWTTMDTATVKSYTVFIGMLLSARPEYLSLVLGRIAQGFTFHAGLQALSTSFPESSASPLTRRVIYDRLHYLLRHIISIIPTLPSTLMPLLAKNFPHKRQKQAAQSTYIRNILRVSGYCPELADKILETIVDRAIQIDVEIQVELEELEEEASGGPEDQDVFELDPFDTVVGQEDDSDSDDDDGDDFDADLSDLSSDAGDMNDVAKEEYVPMNVQHILDMVKKLDTILTLLFQHFERTNGPITTPNDSGSLSSWLMDLPPLPPVAMSPMTPLSSDLFTSRPASPFEPPPSTPPRPWSSYSRSSSPPVPDTQPPSRTITPSLATPAMSLATSKTMLRTQFHTLLAIFDRTILRTFKSRYTQFLLFWYTSLDPEFSDVFQGMLVDRALFQSSTPTVTRAAAASYIGSFVSRANFVDRDGVRRVVSVLCEFLRSHLDDVELSTSLLVQSEQNTVFYAVAQAVFYIFCFRWRELLEDASDFGEEDEGVSGVGKAQKKWMKELGYVQRAVSSSLNPLKGCSPTVAAQFAKVAHATDFIYCYTILDSNKRSEYSSDPNSPSRRIHPALLADELGDELHTFFPFDPYKLPKSNIYIQDVYREWAAVAIDDEEDDEDEEEDEEDEEEEEEDRLGEFGRLTVPRSSSGDDALAKGLGESLGAMSISPAPPPIRAL